MTVYPVGMSKKSQFFFNFYIVLAPGPNNILIKCDESCKTCSEGNNANACLTCYDNFNLISAKCIKVIDIKPSIS